MNSEMISYLRPARGGQALVAVYRLPAGKHTSILTYFQTKVDKKTAQKAQICSPHCHSERMRRISKTFREESVIGFIINSF